MNQTASLFPEAIDQYRLLRPLGWGGAGVVYEAEDTALGRHVALKLIPQRPVAAASLPQAPREARLASRLQHPSVVSLYDTGQYDGGVYIVMEMVQGRSVQSLMDDGPLPWREATRILIAACDGLMAVHNHGIIHRDIKPGNLLFTADGAVKLTDFGLACWLDPSKRSSTLKRPAGTPHYMSPEQCRDDEYDERTDIYALGATYHALLTGASPYTGAAPAQIMFEHCSAPVPDPRKGHRQVPDACAAIVMRAMAKKRAERYEDAREMQRALQTVLGRDKSHKRWALLLVMTMSGLLAAFVGYLCILGHRIAG